MVLVLRCKPDHDVPDDRAATFQRVLTFLSERVLTDTIYSPGIMICFYFVLVVDEP